MPRGRPPKKSYEAKESLSDSVARTSSEEFVVEKIVDKRYVKGKTQYLIKWKGFDDADNSWEPAENLECHDTIKAFEEQRKKEKETQETPEKTVEKRRKTVTIDETPILDTKRSRRSSRKFDEEEDIKKRAGFDRGLRPERILGATDSSGELMFLMKWVIKLIIINNYYYYLFF